MIDLPERCVVCYGVGWTICVDGPRVLCFRCHGSGIEPEETGGGTITTEGGA